MAMLLSVLVSGISVGLLYAAFAVGFTLLFSILKEVNFAYGDSIVFSSYMAYQASQPGLSRGVVVLTGLAAGALTGLFVNFVAMEPLRRYGSSLALVVSGLGAALIMRNAVQYAWGPSPVAFPDVFSNSAFSIAGQTLSFTVLWTFAVALLLVPLITAFLRWTRLGWYIRAVAQDALAARLVGVPVRFTRAMVYAISGVMGALSGLLFGSTYGLLDISFGFKATIVSFIAAVVGGVGSLWGAVLGGLLVGIVESLLAGYISALYKTTFTFTLMVAMLLVLPYGIFGRRGATRV